MAYNPLSITSRGNVSYEGARPKDYIWVSSNGSNSNSGSEDSPLKSIQAAVNRADPGTAIMVKAGTYREDVKITRSGSESNPIWLVSADGKGAAEIKVGGGPAIYTYSGEDNFIIKGFEISGGSEGLKLMGDLRDPTSNVVIQENVIHGQSVDGIKTSKSQNYAIVGNDVYGVNGQEGIDNVYIRDSVIADNRVRDIDGLTGITAKAGAENVKILDNFIQDVRDGISVGGNSTNQGVAWPSSQDFEARNFYVEGNEIQDASRAIRVAGAENSSIVNNVFRTGNGDKPEVWVGRDNNGWESKNIRFSGNQTEGGDWLDVERGSSASVSGGSAQPSEQAPLTAAPAEGSTKTITGTRASETLRGTAGEEVVKGQGGNDKLVASRGSDELHGGSGNDRFDYDSVSASTPRAQDEIVDFGYGKDVIDLSSIDANTRADGNQRFKFIGDDAFDDRAGELRFEKAAGGDWLVKGDVNGDGVADLQILVNAQPQAEMFIL